MDELNPIHLTIPDELAGSRLDQALSNLVPEYSRSRLQQWIKTGLVQVNGKAARQKDKVQGGESITIRPEVQAVEQWLAQPIDLDIVYADASLIVINKPAGLVAHPAPGNRDGTLVNALLHYDASLAAVPRAGVVHRLDKETTGLMVVARTPTSHTALVAALQVHAIHRHYEAVVNGALISGGTVDAPVGRHRVNRIKMAVTDTGKHAVTHYRIAERFREHTLVNVQLETGRTHQIRVHMTHVRHPLVGDPVYGGRLRLPKACSETLKNVLRGFKRQALHAKRLGLIHPDSGEEMEWTAARPADMESLIQALREDARQGNP